MISLINLLSLDFPDEKTKENGKSVFVVVNAVVKYVERHLIFTTIKLNLVDVLEKRQMDFLIQLNIDFGNLLKKDQKIKVGNSI